MLHSLIKQAETLSKLGDYLRDIRESKGYSQRTLALKCGVVPQTIRLIEIGQTRAPNAELIKNIARELRIKPGVIVDLIREDLLDELNS